MPKLAGVQPYATSVLSDIRMFRLEPLIAALWTPRLDGPKKQRDSHPESLRNPPFPTSPLPSRCLLWVALEYVL